MPIRRRRAIAALACALALLAAPAWSQSGYPTKPVRIVVPFPPGQAADTFSRMLAERLTALWGQQVIVENRGGGGGVPGVMAVKDAPADGYTWLVGTSGTLGVNPSVYAKIPYDPLKDLNDPQLRERMIDRGGIPDPRTPQGYTDFIRSEIEKWAQVAKAANVRLDQ